MCAPINNPASCEVRTLIRFLLARNNNAAEIHRHLCEGYGPNVMSDSKVRQWCRLFKEGRTVSMTKSAVVGLVTSQTVWWEKSEYNNSWKSSRYNFRTVPRVSTSFKISDLRYCVREVRLRKTVCQMGAENVNRRTQAETPGCSSSIFATPSN